MPSIILYLRLCQASLRIGAEHRTLRAPARRVGLVRHDQIGLVRPVRVRTVPVQPVRVRLVCVRTVPVRPVCVRPVCVRTVSVRPVCVRPVRVRRARARIRVRSTRRQQRYALGTCASDLAVVCKSIL